MTTKNTAVETLQPTHFINPSVLRLDGQQILAQEYDFCYDEGIENERRFIALFVDFLLLIEKQLLKKNGHNLEQIKFPHKNSDLDKSLGMFVLSLSKIANIEKLMRDCSFNLHLNSLSCFDWNLYCHHLHRQARFKVSQVPEISGSWMVMRQRSYLDTLSDLQRISQIVYKADENHRCNLWNYFEGMHPHAAHGNEEQHFTAF